MRRREKSLLDTGDSMCKGPAVGREGVGLVVGGADRAGVSGGMGRRGRQGQSLWAETGILVPRKPVT